MSKPVIITAALTGAATMKNQNPTVPYTPAEFAEEAYKCWKAGAAMVHVHARDGQRHAQPTSMTGSRTTHDAIKQKCPELIVNLSSAVGMGKTAGAADLADRGDQAGDGLSQHQHDELQHHRPEDRQDLHRFRVREHLHHAAGFRQGHGRERREAGDRGLRHGRPRQHHADREAGLLHRPDELQLRLGRCRRTGVQGRMPSSP